MAARSTPYGHQPGTSTYPQYPSPPIQPQYIQQNAGPPLSYAQSQMNVVRPSNLSPTNGAGRGYHVPHTGRGHPSYQTFPHQPPQFYPQSPYLPSPNPYGIVSHSHPQSSKYAAPPPNELHSYSSTYMHPPPLFSPVYSPQMLSPLPKQPSIHLSQLPLRGGSPLISPITPKPDLSSHEFDLMREEMQSLPPTVTSSSPATVLPLSEGVNEASVPMSPVPPMSGSSKPTPGPSTLGSLPSASRTSASAWAIWSRRPRDPTRAPAIIISPRARPPSSVRDDALDLPSPPPSPPPSPIVDPELSRIRNNISRKGEVLFDDSSSVIETAVTTASTTPAPSTAPDTPIPGSPFSSNTSVSSPMATKVAPALPTSSSPGLEPVPSPSQSWIAGESSVTDGPVTSSVPITPLPAPRPSWASLLRQGDTGSGNATRGALPTSTVIGFSVPAVSMDNHTAALAIPSKQRSELLAVLTSTTPLPGWGAPQIVPRGLVNQGNMCFANCVLQVLVYCPPFHRLFSEIGRILRSSLSGKVDAGKERGTPLVDATVTFLHEFLNTRSRGRDDDELADSFMPIYVYDAMKEKPRFDSMRGGHQEDAEEFLGFYLDTLEEELLSLVDALEPSAFRSESSPPGPLTEKEEQEPAQGDGWTEVGKRNKMVVTRMAKTTDSPITRVFGGKFRSALRAPGMRDSVTIEDWRSLQLDIQREQVHTIQDALGCIALPQSVQISTLSQPGVLVEASQQVLIDVLPPILVLHLKRFQYDTEVKGVVKISKQIVYGPELEVPLDLIAPARRSVHPPKYKLFSVLYHHGLSASGGHYTLDVLHPNRDLSNGKAREAWIRIDDELVSDVRHDDVFNVSDREDRCAYLLFYRRVTLNGGRT